MENGELATYENVRFHKLLAKASKNQVFLIVIECMQAVYRDFLLRCYIDMDITRFVIRCNAGILAAIKEKNRKKAEDCLEKKLLMLSKNIIPYEDKEASDQNLANSVWFFSIMIADRLTEYPIVSTWIGSGGTE